MRGGNAAQDVLFRREPSRRRRAEVARGDVDDAVRQLEVLHQFLLDGKQILVLVSGQLWTREREHLDLVELMHAEHPSRVLASGTRLATEAGRECRVVQRQ